MLLRHREAKQYASTAIGVTSRKITYCKKTGRGFSNRSFCIVAGEKAYHVRLANNLFSLDRHMERLVCEAAGFDFLDFNEDNGNYVRPWINGETVRAWDENKLRQVARLLRELHNKKPPPGLVAFDPYLYDRQVKLPEKYAALYKELAGSYARNTTVWCHNDVHGSNVVAKTDGQLVLIDYEWSSLNNPLWELGNFVREEGLTTVQIGVLVNEYGADVTLKGLYDHVFLAACYGWMWARAMPWSLKIAKQRRKTTKDLKAAFKGTQLTF